METDAELLNTGRTLGWMREELYALGQDLADGIAAVKMGFTRADIAAFHDRGLLPMLLVLGRAGVLHPGFSQRKPDDATTNHPD